MTTHKNLMTLCVAALFTLGLAACGSDGSDPVVMEPDPAPPEPTDGGTITWEQLSSGYTAMPGEGGTTYTLDLDTLPEDVDIHDVEGEHMFAAGATLEIAGVNFMCAAGSTGCTVEIDHDGHITIMGGNIMTAAATPPEPEPIDVERKTVTDAIAAAMAAVNAVNDASTDEMVAAAEMAVEAAMRAINGATRIPAGEVATHRASLATISGNLTAAMASRTMVMNLANQRQAISDTIAAAMAAVGAVNDDSDAATVKAAEDAIAAANAAIEAAADIPASEAATARSQVAAIYDDLSDAKESRQAAIDAAAEAERMAREAEQRRTMQLAAITSAISMANTAVAAVNDTADDATVAAADAAVEAARTAIANAADVSAADLAGHTAMVNGLSQSLNTAKTSRQMAMDASRELANQRTAISNAIDMARTAVNAVNNDSTDEQVDAADTAVANARLAIAGASDVPDQEKAANTGTVDALAAQLASAKTSRQMAASAAAEAQRMANISAAQAVLTSAEAALEALADDATDEQKRDAQRMIEAAANALRDALQMNGGSQSEIEAAIRKAQTAKVAADALQATITAAAIAEEARQMAAINAAQTALSNAETELAELGEDATDKERRDAHRAVETAASALLQVLEDNGGTADQIAAATMTRDSAKTMADALTSPVEIAEQRQAITDALDLVRTTVAAVNDDATDAQVKAADDAVAAARKAIEDATELPGQETDAHDAVVNAYADILTTAKTSRMAKLDAEREEREAETREALNKVALTKKAAITAELNTAADGTKSATPPANRPFDSATAYDTSDGADNTATNFKVDVKHTGSAVEVEVTDGHADFDAKNDPKFAKTLTFGNGQMLVRNDGTTREIIVLHTDIDAPVAHRFGTSASGYEFDEDLDSDTSAEDTYAVTAGDGSKLGGSRIVGPDVGDTKALALWEATGENAKNVFSGTLDGAAGTFRCETGPCVVTTGEDGAHTFTGTLWFTPNSGATVQVQDDDYLTYGFWLNTTTKDGDITSYGTVQTFATSGPGLTATPATELSAVTGSATYEGDAAGVYVHESKKEDGTLDTATSGRFTADVALKAYFTGDPLRTNGSIAGTVSNFDLDGGPDNSWKVDLTATGITADGGFSSADGAKGGGVDASWNGQFRGEAAVRTEGAAARAAPPALIGEFNSNFVNGTAAGAFGARTE